ncbi:UDP-4-amino-4,6-dideoxy-N-acetyl-beta-L-altrosamine transaminase [Aquiluna borgnonia]|uniref:UDP-4-amino-4, 6-dideoxy-N-acetyl-beta-L-altrosamine transaminase n=1 Tax=Aquiluna borgnonia TaxID=2499157 RepID=A0A7D4PYE7_9MICO|nr:UDP-4-amino-4,6-dideoxy-N-acetyl-beta-L-altrosamine transaminase [Aquiluna borgnonia]QKJ25045.1 UDP-4-amino-4,6-dideoxy-N-acetyl-beta-L-altrosamine transaminase [Aquiluna borgnonia]
MIPYSRQHISFIDRCRVFRALGKPYLTQGPAVEKFESQVCDLVGAAHAIAVNSATSALHLACLALGLKAGDEMWTTSISFVASANCGRYVGATVDFVDIDPETWNICPRSLREKLEHAKTLGRLPKLVVVVHLAGEPAALGEIHLLSKEFGFKIIEDASHALGSKYMGSAIGNGRFSDITVFSFHAIKNLTTGEGGMALTNDGQLAETMRSLRSHGITRDEAAFVVEERSRTPWHYEQQGLGFNYRITDFQCALGSSQLKKLDRVNRRRLDILRLYKSLLSEVQEVSFQKMGASNESAAHLAIIKVPRHVRQTLQSALAAAGFGTNLHYFPIHLQPYHFDPNRNELKNAEDYAHTAISLPCHQSLSFWKVKHVSKLIAQVIESTKSGT